MIAGDEGSDVNTTDEIIQLRDPNGGGGLYDRSMDAGEEDPDEGISDDGDDDGDINGEIQYYPAKKVCGKENGRITK